MEIKRIIEYEYNYAEYEVTDGMHSLICMCLSVPLKHGKEPQVGMKIAKLYAFSFGETINIGIADCKECDIQKKNYFGYELRGSVLDVNKAIIKIFGFMVDLSDYYPNGFGNVAKIGDYVTFQVDRLDCTILGES